MRTFRVDHKLPRLVSVDVDVCVLKCDGEVELWYGREIPINVCNSMLVGWSEQGVMGRSPPNSSCLFRITEQHVEF